MMALNFRTFM